MPEAVILDYGAGNLLSLKFALERAGLPATIRTTSEQMSDADAIVLPGVGNFSAALEKLNTVRDDILEAVESGIPMLGICLGLQLFFQTSEEGPGNGLGLFEGRTMRLPDFVKVPHMGWNTLSIVKENSILEGIDDNSYVYFVHSLYPMPIDKKLVCTLTNYGTSFVSTVASENVFGTQFHPEKSGEIGLTMMKNFARIVAK